MNSSKNSQYSTSCTASLPHGACEATRAGRVLIVEADPAMRFLVSSSLRSAGHTVMDVENPEHALLLADQGQKFDLVITELEFKVTGGVAMARRLLDMGAVSGIVFISRSAAVTRVLGRAVGAGKLISEPFSAADLRRHVEDALQRRHTRQNNWAKQRLRSLTGRSERSLWRMVSRTAVS